MGSKEIDLVKLANDLRIKRLKDDLNLRDLSGRIGVPIATLSRIERESMPEVNTLISILCYIGSTLEQYYEHEPINDKYEECCKKIAMENGYKSIDHMSSNSQTPGLVYKKLAKLYAFEIAKEVLLIAAENAEIYECNGYPTKDVILNTKINVS